MTKRDRSIHARAPVTRCSLLVAALATGALLSTALPNYAEARPVRNTTRTAVNRGGGNVNRGANVNRNQNVNRNTNVNRNQNVNVNRDIDVDVDHHHGYGYYGHGGHYHPVATAVGVAAAATVTAIAVGSIVNSLPPSCSAVVANGITYQNCSGTWYQPRYSGTQVTYVVVNQP